MSTCCPNCSASALGTEAATLCTECATATVAGASFSLPVLIAGALAVGAAVVAFRVLRPRAGALLRARRAALA